MFFGNLISCFFVFSLRYQVILMHRYFFLTALTLLFCFDLVGQDLLTQFKTLEKKVRFNDPDQLVEFAHQLDSTSIEEQAFKKWIVGRSLFWNSNYPSAYEKMESALVLIKQLKDSVLLGELYLDLSAALAVVDENGRALDYSLQATDLLDEVGGKEQRVRAAISLGEMYRKIGQYDDSYRVLNSILSETDEVSIHRARCLNRLAAVSSETGKWEESMNYSYRSLEIAETLGDRDLIATSENEIGYALRHGEDVEKSLSHFYRADSLWQSIGKIRYAASPKHHVAIVYRTLHQFEKALNYTREAYALIKGRGWYQIEMNLLDDLKMTHDYFGNKDSVLFYDRERLQAAINFKTKQFEVNTKMVEVLHTQKENEQIIREQKIKLRNESLEKDAISRERTTLWIIVSLIIIILLIIFVYAFNQRKLQMKLSRENREKEKKNEELLNALGANEALVQEISHRVKNNLAVLAGLLTMQANRSESEKVKKELKDSVLRIDSIATIHKKLYDKRTDAKVNLKDALEELSTNVIASMGKDPKAVFDSYLEDIEIDIAEAVTLCLIVNEALTNSCKYANVSAENKVHVSLRSKSDKIKCCVIDHGPGFEEIKISSKTKSLGVYLIKLLSKQLKAELNWEKSDRQFRMCIEINKNG